VILSKKVQMNMGPILNGYRDMVKRRYEPSCEHEQQLRNKRSEERRVGKECSHWCRSRWSGGGGGAGRGGGGHRHDEASNRYWFRRSA
jgi:hypothetical protein